jgi:hypothetical protein
MDGRRTYGHLAMPYYVGRRINMPDKHNHRDPRQGRAVECKTRLLCSVEGREISEAVHRFSIIDLQPRWMQDVPRLVTCGNACLVERSG